MAELMRNYISSKTVDELTIRIGEVYPKFEQQEFRQFVYQGMGELGLYERLERITCGLIRFLPASFPEAADVLVASLGEELDAVADDPVAKEYGSSRGFVVVALANYIVDSYQTEEEGRDYFDRAMEALYEMTKRFSSEIAIRHLIRDHEQRTLNYFKRWVKDPNVHVRRLVSESLRPKLPWALRLHQYVDDPRPILPFLKSLSRDRHLYVRRSVANNLNDISKDHPDLVVQTLTEWNTQPSSHMKWLTKHALRTLVKQGHAAAVQLLGYSKQVKVSIDQFDLHASEIPLGESLVFELTLSADASESTSTTQNLIIDYAIYHVKANGSLSPKVFKWKTIELTSHRPVRLVKKHAIRPITTRVYYPGTHELHLLINGNDCARVSFNLSV